MFPRDSWQVNVLQLSTAHLHTKTLDAIRCDSETVSTLSLYKVDQGCLVFVTGDDANLGVPHNAGHQELVHILQKARKEHYTWVWFDVDAAIHPDLIHFGVWA